MEFIAKPISKGEELVVLIPNDIVRILDIRENKPLKIRIEKMPKSDKEKLKSLFGSANSIKTAQESKDEMRKGWD